MVYRVDSGALRRQGGLMYIPSAFRQDDREAVRALVGGYPPAEMVTVGPGGLLATTVPLLVEVDGTRTS